MPNYGSNNITADPLFLDGTFHISPASPCRGAGNALYATGYDLDGEPFANPPAIGCDEFIEADQTGPLTFTFQSPWTATFTNFQTRFAATFNGRVSRLEWSFGDGATVTNTGYYIYHAWTNPGLYPVTLTAYNLDHPTGVTSNFSVFVDIRQPVVAWSGIVNNTFQLNFLGQTNAFYSIQYCTNLTPPITWFYWQNIFSYGGVTNVQDATITNASSARFYRILSQ